MGGGKNPEQEEGMRKGQVFGDMERIYGGRRYLGE